MGGGCPPPTHRRQGRISRLPKGSPAPCRGPSPYCWEEQKSQKKTKQNTKRKRRKTRQEAGVWGAGVPHPLIGAKAESPGCLRRLIYLTVGRCGRCVGVWAPKTEKCWICL